MSITLAITNGTIISPDGNIEGGTVLIEDNKIRAIEPKWSSTIDKNIPLKIDAKDLLVLPGFIDLHVHGAGGADVMDADYEALCTIAKTLPKFGVTAFCPATITAPHDEIIASLKKTAYAVENGTGGAKIIGGYLEGPFVSSDVKVRGVHDPKFICLPDVNKLEEYFIASGGHLKFITIAPELYGADQLILAARKLNIISTIGHTLAGFKDTKRAIEVGASHATHFYNFMAPFHHREPGVLGAIFMNEKVSIELIADGKLISPEALQISLKIFGLHRIILITDCLRPLGDLNMKRFSISGTTIIVNKKGCFLEDGSFCNSLLTMIEALRNAISFLNLPINKGILLTSLNPAMKLGIANRKGSIKVGKDADLVVCDSRLNVIYTIVEGKLIYSAH